MTAHRSKGVLGLTTLGAAVLTAGLLVAPGAVAAAAAGTPSEARATVQATPPLPAGARVLGTLSAAQSLTVDVVLAMPDPTALDDFVDVVSTPGSPEFHRFLAPGQFAARFGPSPASIAAVRAWLGSTGLSVGPTTPDGLVVPVTGPAPAIGQAFATPVRAVVLASGRTAYANTAAPSVPSSLAPQVQALIGLDNLTVWHDNLALSGTDTRRRAASGSATGTGPGSESPQSDTAPSEATPAAIPQANSPSTTDRLAAPVACPAAAAYGAGGSLTQNQLATVYGLSPLYAEGRGGGGVTIALYELEPHLTSDITAFDQCYGLDNPLSTVQVDGGAGYTGAGSGEAALDIEDASSLAPQARILVYEGPNSDDNLAGAGPFDTLQRIATDDAAQIVSTSWGQCEALDTPVGIGDGSAAGAEAVVFAEMAAQGQTVVAASGDSGSEGCWDPIDQPPDPTELQVEDPAAQPDVTGVGGTSLPNGSTVGEEVWNDCQGISNTTCAEGGGAGGGGISANWPMPAWQAAAGNGTVNPFSSGAPCANATGDCREVPDVSAAANPRTSYIYYWAGQWGPVGGTSGAAPLWGALLALTTGGCASSLGLVNPSLYALGSVGSSAFHDVTVAGDNNLTGSANAGHYPTTVGYDMATGWGSPDGVVLSGDLQPPGGCPAVIALSNGNGPVGGGGTLTIFGSSLQGATAVHFGPTLSAPILSDSATSVTVAIPPAPGPLAVDVTVTTANGTSAAVPQDRYIFGTPRNGLGYWLGAADGGIFSFGDAAFYGSMGGRALNRPIVGLAATPDGGGYWEVASDGGIFSFGDAAFYGSMGGRALNRPIVGLAATPDGGGYWEVASDGGIFSFGDAAFYGSMGGRALNRPIVGLAATPDGGGYWEVASDGGIFSFGDAAFYGSMGGRALNQPIVGIAPTLDGNGYWEVAADGGLFSFGDAAFYGSMGARPLNRPIVAMLGTPDSGGYWEVAADGGLFSFGDANFFGSTGALALVEPIVGMADT